MLDIAIMKLVAISSRGSKKDYYDLYYLCKYQNIDYIEVYNSLEKKYINKEIPMMHIIQSLTFFDDAEKQGDINMLIDINWKDVKDYFLKLQTKLFEIYNK